MIRPCQKWHSQRRRFFSTTEALFSSYQNAAGIYHLQEDMQRKVFGKTPRSGAQDNKELQDKLQEIALDHLAHNSLLNQETIKPQKLNIKIPDLVGNSDLDEHFQKIGNHMLQPYQRMCENYIKNITGSFNLNIDTIDFLHKSGWVRYTTSGQSQPKPVKYPEEDVITFDTEVLYKIHDYAVMAVAIGSDALYVWLSPWLLGETKDPAQLIPLGDDDHHQVVVGHYVAYDRKRVLEEYSITNSKKWFLDTMGLHIATNGMCNQQRNTFTKFESLKKQSTADKDSPKKSVQAKLAAILKQEPWLRHTCGNGLDDAVAFHMGEYLDKGDRELFGELTREEAVEPTMLNDLIKYCARDALATKRLFAVLLPKFLALNPHPVSFGALRLMSSQFLPINEDWNTYVETAESYFDQLQSSVNEKLKQLAEEAAAYADDPEKLAAALKDPWLGQLDWTITPIKYTKPRPGHPARPVKNQKMPGKPKWYKELFPSKDRQDINLSARSRTTTLLLRLTWNDQPLVWFDEHGWTFWTTTDMKPYYKNLNLSHVMDDDNGRSLFKLPHPDGDKGRCTYPLAKFYFQFFENHTLKSENKLAGDAISTNLECSYWISARQRVMNQMPVFDKNLSDKTGLPAGWGMILPRMAPIGAVTRRAVEDTWLTASNAKQNRVGSELKSNVKAPPGYKIIGADVDSEELWIASVVGDSIFKMHGGTAAGWMTLEGTKKAGTDLHSKSAQILSISRNEAKVFNYGRIYGSGKSSAARTLRQFNPSVSVAEADRKATELYKSTKGEKTVSKHFPLKHYWRGGTESVMYNQLELLAEQPRQRTPILGAGISDALCAENLKKSSFLTTRVNWSIQSSGVDYLHLLIAGMHYLTEVYHINARLMITVHDEVRFLATEEDAYRASLALQVANLWTRAFFCQQLGFDNLPYSVAFFSAVDIDHVLRKDVDDPCVTPSQPEPLAPGEALDIVSLASKCSDLGEIDLEKAKEFTHQKFDIREPVMQKINQSPIIVEYAKAQTGTAAQANQIEAQLSKRKRRTSRGSFDQNKGDNDHNNNNNTANIPRSGNIYRARQRLPHVKEVPGSHSSNIKYQQVEVS